MPPSGLPRRPGAKTRDRLPGCRPPTNPVVNITAKRRSRLAICAKLTCLGVQLRIHRKRASSAAPARSSGWHHQSSAAARTAACRRTSARRSSPAPSTARTPPRRTSRRTGSCRGSRSRRRRGIGDQQVQSQEDRDRDIGVDEVVHAGRAGVRQIQHRYSAAAAESVTSVTREQRLHHQSRPRRSPGRCAAAGPGVTATSSPHVRCACCAVTSRPSENIASAIAEGLKMCAAPAVPLPCDELLAEHAGRHIRNCR